ncbi:neutral zinc metallopeptidase [Actinomadura harenae]|uniref:Metalloprotease n=1 Tax=Actinomadura harenae TaxID=2483351 RepID=A0A3M2LET5_9ACTN|nr:hypothetical protein [Actinomadura harenae]RMI35924.1 hypothetical protein EBO15_40015 [Actinomadura harenae]
MPLPRLSPARFRRPRSLTVLLLAACGVGAVPGTASAFTATPGDGPVVLSPGSLTPGSPTGAFPVPAGGPASIRASGAAFVVDTGAAAREPGASSMPGTDASFVPGADASFMPGTTAEEATPLQQDLQQDLQDAQDVVDAFWRRHWAETFGGRYAPPAVLGPYDGANPAATPRCGPRLLERDNAAYCPDGDYLAWDEHLMRVGQGTGDAWMYMVIAHEWGHAVQHRMPSRLVSRRGELQADCLAGAALAGAARDGALHADPGDRNEIDAEFHQIGDGTPWARPGDHGTAAQRIAEFARGGAGGVRACLP